MSFLDRISRRRIPPNAAFRLTQEGRERIQNFSGDSKSRVLVALETRGTSDIEEISLASGLTRGQVERILPAMVRGGFVQYISSSPAEELK